MIFATIGTQAPFDRFLRIIDRVAGEMDEEFVVQAFRDKYVPEHVRQVDFMSPDEFDRVFEQARLIVAHAGMGTIITALRRHKPVIVFPRLASLGEHRNEHQTATARQMAALGYAHVAYNEDELAALIKQSDLPVLCTLGERASDGLIQSLKDFIG